MNDSSEPRVVGSITRREAIKRSAVVVGGAAWAAPVVTSLASPAFASSPPPYGECTDTYKFSIKYGSTTFVAKELGTNACKPKGWDEAAERLSADGRVPNATPGITVTWNYKGDKRRALITLPAGCTLLDGDAKARRKKKSKNPVECSDVVGMASAPGRYVVRVSKRRIAWIHGVICVI